METMENTPKAIILIIIGMSFVAFQDVIIKIISSETNVFLILLSRAFIGLILLLIFMTFVMVLPSAPGTIGTFQASIIFVMTSNLFGYNKGDDLRHSAESFSIILHAYSYITYSIIGGYFFLRSNINVNN